MKVLDLMDQLEDLVDNASTMPLTGKAMVNREEVMGILKDMRVIIPDEVKQAKWIKDERAKILEDAEAEANRIKLTAQDESKQLLSTTQERVERMVHRDEITEQARVKGQEIIDNANQQADQIKHGAYRYADEIMQKLEGNILKIGDSIRKNRTELESYKAKVEE